MSAKILINKKYAWHSEKVGDLRIYTKGLFRYKKKSFRDVSVYQKLTEIFNITKADHCTFSCLRDKIKGRLSKLGGHYSFIVDSPGFVLAVVDKIRSHPVFYSTKNGVIHVSNSAIELKDAANLHEKDKTSFLEFEMAGYVTGSSTLYKDLLQLQAGEFLLFDKRTGSLDMIRYYRYWADETIGQSEEDLLEELHSVTTMTFTDMVETFDGRPVWVPLSGGLDSRLVLAKLCELKYDNISTFTYGIPGHWEADEAKRIAEILKVNWHYIPYDSKKIKVLFHTKEREQYICFASGLSVAPALSDFYALWILRDDRVIPDNSIIINGQAGDYLTGGHIPKMIVEQEGNNFDTAILLKEIIDKHFSLWLNFKTEENFAKLFPKIHSLLQLPTNTKLSLTEFVKYYELYEWQERQSKYVVNGQRMYEWFGYDWRLPLWSDDLMSFWVKIDWQNKFEQLLHKTYLKRYNPGNVFSIASPTQHPYTPFPIKILNVIFSILCRITGENTGLYQRKYSRYFMTYAPFYPQRSYLEYLKDSQWHRNPVSYLARDVIENL